MPQDAVRPPREQLGVADRRTLDGRCCGVGRLPLGQEEADGTERRDSTLLPGQICRFGDVAVVILEGKSPYVQIAE